MASFTETCPFKDSVWADGTPALVAELWKLADEDQPSQKLGGLLQVFRKRLFLENRQTDTETSRGAIPFVFFLNREWIQIWREYTLPSEADLKRPKERATRRLTAVPVPNVKKGTRHTNVNAQTFGRVLAQTLGLNLPG